MYTEDDAVEAVMLEGLDPMQDDMFCFVDGDSEIEVIELGFLSPPETVNPPPKPPQFPDEIYRPEPGETTIKPGDGFLYPGGVTVRPANWIRLEPPYKYRVAGGDTLIGISTTYLGDPARFREIWNLQPEAWRYARSPNYKIFVGDVLTMPNEAGENFLAWKNQGSDPTVTPGEVGPHAPGGGGGGGGGAPAKKDRTALYVGGALAAAALGWALFG